MNRKKSIDSKSSLIECKHCKTKLEKMDIEKHSRKFLSERYGVYWTGVEKPYIQIFKINCPNPRCRKSYTIRTRESLWIYK